MLKYFDRQIQLSLIITVAAVVFHIFHHTLSHRRLSSSGARRTTMTVWILWAMLLIVIFTIDPLGIREHSVRSLDLVPFSGSEYVHNTPSLIFGKIGFNVLLFVPFGFVLLQATRWKFLQCVIAGAVLSLCVETIQFIATVGSSATADVILNTLGTSLGALGALGVSVMTQVFKQFQWSRLNGKLEESFWVTNETFDRRNVNHD